MNKMSSKTKQCDIEWLIISKAILNVRSETLDVLWKKCCKMEASEPKWVNSILYIIGVNLLKLGGFQIVFGVTMCCEN